MGRNFKKEHRREKRNQLPSQRVSQLGLDKETTEAITMAFNQIWEEKKPSGTDVTMVDEMEARTKHEAVVGKVLNEMKGIISSPNKGERIKNDPFNTVNNLYNNFTRDTGSRSDRDWRTASRSNVHHDASPAQFKGMTNR